MPGDTTTARQAFVALYVQLRRQPSDDDAIVTYDYWPEDAESSGQVCIRIGTGDVAVRRLASNDPAGRYAQYASQKLRQYARANEFPDVGCWAS